MKFTRTLCFFGFHKWKIKSWFKVPPLMVMVTVYKCERCGKEKKL